MKIQVTQQNIYMGLRGSCSGDPIALAMQDAKIIKPWVSPTLISWLDVHGFKKSMDTPESVVYFMERYDNGLSVQPFEFELEEA
jgi:hypothetical protein